MDAPDPVAVEDATGRVVRLDSPAARVVSLIPSATEWILAVGAAERLVARTGYDTDPRLSGLPSFGRTTAPSPETVIALEPDLVLLMSDPGARGLVRPLDRAGAPTAVFEARTIEQAFDVGRRIGELVGRAERADSLAGALERRLDAVRALAPAAPGAASSPTSGRMRPTVLYVLWPDPPRIAGAGTFVGDIIEAAGGRAAFPELDEPWPQVGLEALVARDPDHLIVPRGVLPGDAASGLRQLPGWSRLSAVRAGRVIEVEGTLFERPGPRLVEAAETLARALRRSVSR